MPGNNVPNQQFHEEDSFTGLADGVTINLGKGERFTISAYFGTPGVGALTLQRKLPSQADFRDVESYTADTEKDGIGAETQEIRLSCTVHTSGTIVGRIGK